MDDEALVRAAVQGDRTAFASIYDRYADRVHAFATSVLRDPDEAADVTQDTFLVAARRLDQLRDPTRLRPWLFAIARHESFRRSKKRGRHVLTDELEDHASTERSTEDAVSSREAATIVQEAAAGLTERDRAVLDLSLRHGLEGEELGAAMGISPGHASVLAGRVKERVERSLGALLVARLGRDDCTQLQDVLADWDGSFSPLVRKRVARHVERCTTCSATKRRVASPAALLASAPIVAAPTSLRARVLDAFDAQAAAATPGTSDAPPSDAPPPDAPPSGDDATGSEAAGSEATGSEATGGEGPGGEQPSTTTALGPPPTPPIHLGHDGFPRSGNGRRAVAVGAVLLLLLVLAGAGVLASRDEDSQAVATVEAEEEAGRNLTVVDQAEAAPATTTGSLVPPSDPDAGGAPGDDGGTDEGGGTTPVPDPGGSSTPPPTDPVPPPPPPPPPDVEGPFLRVSAVPPSIMASAAFCPAGPTQSTVTAHASDPSGITSVSSNYGMTGGGGTWRTTIGPFIASSMGTRTVPVTVTAVDGAGNRSSRTVTVTVVC